MANTGWRLLRTVSLFILLATGWCNSASSTEYVRPKPLYSYNNLLWWPKSGELKAAILQGCSSAKTISCTFDYGGGKFGWEVTVIGRNGTGPGPGFGFGKIQDTPQPRLSPMVCSAIYSIIAPRAGRYLQTRPSATVTIVKTPIAMIASAIRRQPPGHLR